MDKPTTISEAWVLLAHHPSIMQQDALCRLLCCSRAIAATLKQHCAGRVEVNMDVPETTRIPHLTDIQEAWIAKHGGMLNSLAMTFVSGPSFADAMKAAAASSPQGLQLQSFAPGEVGSLAELQQLPLEHLTALECTPVELDDTGAATLAALTGLRSLKLNTNDYTRQPALPMLVEKGIAPLTNLTHLTLSMSGTMGMHQLRTAGLQHLPASLVSLRIGIDDEMDKDIDWDAAPRTPPPLNLGHLTALTELRPIPAPIHSAFDIRSGDKLPPILRVLEFQHDPEEFGDPFGVLPRPLGPLLVLQQLQELRVRCCAFTQQQLGQLRSALPGCKVMTTCSLRGRSGSWFD